MQCMTSAWDELEQWDIQISRASHHKAAHPADIQFGSDPVIDWSVMARGKKGLKSTGSGASSSGASATDSPTSGTSLHRAQSRERVGNYDLVGVSQDWDNSAVLRQRIRDGHHLCRHMSSENMEEEDTYVESSMDDVRVNKFVLVPLMTLMAQHDLLLPNLDRLIQSIDLLYQTAKKPRSLEHSYQQAWAIRRLIQQVKSHLYKNEPPQDWIGWTDEKYICREALNLNCHILIEIYHIYIP